MVLDAIVIDDALYATRIEAYYKSGKIEKAEMILDRVKKVIKRPILSYDALYLAYLKSGGKNENIKALLLKREMKESGMRESGVKCIQTDEHDASSHLKTLTKLGRFIYMYIYIDILCIYVYI